MKKIKKILLKILLPHISFVVLLVPIEYLNLYFNDVALRVKFSLYSSLALNAAYAFMQFGLGLSLETAMLTAFGEGERPIFRKTMTASTGAVVCVVILSMSIYMIVSSTKQLNQIKRRREK